MYITIPVILYAGERILTSVQDHNYRVNIIKVVISKLQSFYRNARKSFKLSLAWTMMQAIVYRGNVLALYMSKPPGFKYKSGMYIFVKCPDIASFEW